MINNQFGRAVTAQNQQIISNQQNVFIPENASLIHNTPQLSEALYFHQQPQLNMNAISQIQAQHYTNPHSLMGSIAGMPQTSVNNGAAAGIYDNRLTRLYTTTTTNGIPSTSSNNANLIENTLSSSIPNQSNTILIDNYGAQLQTDQPQQQIYRHSAQVPQHFPPSVQLQHSNVAREQTQRSTEHAQPTQNFDHSNVVTPSSTSSSSQMMQLHHLPSTHQPIFLTADAFGTTPSGKMSAYLPFKVNSSFPSAAALNEMYQRQLQTSSTASGLSSSAVANTNSPVVLDRINICINNHYSDHNFSTPVVDTGSACANSTADTPSLSSPIIPPIQHSAVIDPGLLIEPPHLHNNETNNSTINIATPVLSTVNEPDSTTASHTPPSTPDNTSNLIASANAIQSPSTSSTAKVDESFKDFSTSLAKTNNDDDGEDDDVILVSPEETAVKPVETLDENSTEIAENVEHIAQCSETTSVVNEKIFTIGDDVFVRIDDDRLYLGTIIDSKYQKYRVRFDDSSEMWCSAREMRKFGVCEESNTSSSGGERNALDDSDSGTLCVACKKRDLVDLVEICERCGRGYHKLCTTETSPGSGEWLCKRCSKSMKVHASDMSGDEYDENCLAISEQRPKLPYDMKTLHWDSKHRVNEEQIYCYCGRSGQFDYNMLQCCKCRNWYHTGCIQNFNTSMLRGDGFFVFCCAVCSPNANEFLRRLQMSCVDFMHLVLYNLSIQKKHQHNKYHHLTKDIWPFVLSQKHTSALPEEWFNLNENELKDCILSTLKENTERFVCGREVKRDYYFYGLRTNGPPPTTVLPQICQEEEINNKFIVENLKLKLSSRAPENKKHADTVAIQPTILHVIETSDKEEDTDGKFTSDDEIPIKLILEKEKVKNKLTVFDSNGEQHKHQNESTKPTEIIRQSSEKKLTVKVEIKSHKRKAFKLSRPYKELSALEDKKCRTKTHNSNCESSSDENSSSSRGTSLDLIIPPPKDFLGANNPFRTVTTTPKNGAVDRKISPFGASILGGPTIRNSVVNAPALDFCSNLTALKNAGMLPNLSTTNFSRAAGQPRMVRTIKRRLSAKDIMIGPNQEIRRRRTRRLSSNVEVISTTTINPISSFFPINASNCTKTTATILRKHNFSTTLPGPVPMPPKIEKRIAAAAKTNIQTATHGRRLRLRPQNSLPTTTNSRRSSLSGASTSSISSSSLSSSGNATPQTAQYSESVILSDLQQTVNRYFGVSHLIATGEQFSVHAKRQLQNGQIQLLIEWGGVKDENLVNADSTIAIDTGEKTTISQENS